MKYVVLGGAGAMGRIVVRDLFEFAERGDEIVIADYDAHKAEALANEYREAPRAKGAKPCRLKATQVDVRNQAQMTPALRGAFVAINCVQHHWNLDVMAAAIQARVHYLDLGGLFHWTRQQLRLHQQFQAIDRLAVLGVGAAPGITNLLACAGAERLETVREIHCRVANVDQTRYRRVPALPLSYSLHTILEEFSMAPAVFTRGKLVFVAPLSGLSPMRFPPPVGAQKPFYTIHSEVATLPASFADKGVREVSFKIAFAPSFLERVRFLCDLGLASREPLSVGQSKVAPVDLLMKVVNAQQPAEPIGSLRQHEVVRAIVKGTRAGRQYTLLLDCHTTGHPRWRIGADLNTGVPPAIVARMLAAGEVRATGVLPPEKAVPPHTFWRHLERRGLWLRTRTLRGWSLPT